MITLFIYVLPRAGRNEGISVFGIGIGSIMLPIPKFVTFFQYSRYRYRTDGSKHFGIGSSRLRYFQYLPIPIPNRRFKATESSGSINKLVHNDFDKYLFHGLFLGI